MEIKNPFRLLSRKSAVQRPIKLTDTDGGSAFYTFMTNWSTVKNTTTISGQAWAYNYCPSVNAVINKKVRAFTNGRWFVLDPKGNIVNSDKNILCRLLKRPNPLQTWREFVAQAKIYEQVFGEVYIIPVNPAGWDTNDQAGSVWVIPNWIITENITGKIFQQSTLEGIVEDYTISVSGSKVTIPAKNILRIRDISMNVTEDPKLLLHGQSRLYSLTDPVSNIVAAYEARNVLITRKGALGILSNDGHDVGGTIPLKPKEKKELQDDFQTYGLSREQFQVIITNASLKWQSMTFPTRELMLFEEVMDCTRQIADSYDYPMFLLGFKEGTTFSNVGEAKKSLYQDAIIPESDAFAESFSDFFLSKDGLRLSVSYQHLEIFQRSRKDIADSIRLLNQGMVTAYQNKIITLQEWRKILSNTLLEGELNPEQFFGDTFFEGITPQKTPGNQVHQEEPKIRS